MQIGVGTTTILATSGTVLDSESYSYNQGNQRTAETNTAGDYRNYTYDNIGELKTANGKESGGTTNRLQEQFGYAYDAAGNLNQRTNNALVQNFNVNNLNELSTVARSGTLTVAGTTTSPATNVTVNSQIAATYADATFAKDGFSLADGSNTFTAVAKDTYGRVDTNSVTVNLPATNNFAYDLNGNLLTNGTQTLDYDDENQLIRVTVANQFKKEYVYDGLRRLRIRKEFGWAGSSWTQTNEIHYIWDGDVILQQRDANNLPTLTLTRGNDLSGSLQGAGGIGGLLAMTESSGTHSYYHADGNGNVTCLINANQLVVAKYLYDPFGNPLSESGSKAFVNPIWFSSQLYDPTTGFLQYLYRVYIPEINRFANQDPIQEAGGINLYEFVGNNPIGNIDYLGEDSGLADPYPWYMLFYGFYGPSFISPPLPGGFVAQAKDRASSIENALMQGVKMKCGQSGTEPVSDSSSPKIGIGSSYTGGWDLNITGNCQWTCEQATKPDCCCNCKIQCNFHGDFSKTWTFQPWGYNPENNLLIWRLVWSYTLTSQLRLYGPLALISPAKYHMEGSFDDSKSLPNKKICEK